MTHASQDRKWQQLLEATLWWYNYRQTDISYTQQKNECILIWKKTGRDLSYVSVKFILRKRERRKTAWFASLTATGAPCAREIFALFILSDKGQARRQYTPSKTVRFPSHQEKKVLHHCVFPSYEVGRWKLEGQEVSYFSFILPSLSTLRKKMSTTCSFSVKKIAASLRHIHKISYEKKPVEKDRASNKSWKQEKC